MGRGTKDRLGGEQDNVRITIERSSVSVSGLELVWERVNEWVVVVEVEVSET